MSTSQVQSFKDRAAKAREFIVPVTSKPGWSFTLRRPTDLAIREAFSTGEAVNAVKFQADTVYASLQGWSGPTIGDIDPAATAEEKAMPLPFDPELYEVVFGDRPEVLDELGASLMAAFAGRRKQREEAAKN